MKKKALLMLLVVTFILVSLAGCSYNEPCELCRQTPTKKYVTVNGTDRYYCEYRISTCAFCNKKATKNYTSLLDLHIFVCDDHYNEVLELNTPNLVSTTQ